MTKPKKELVSISDTPYYHIVSRCVRRTFLCGFDHETNTDYRFQSVPVLDYFPIFVLFAFRFFQKF